MHPIWSTADQQPGTTPLEAEFARSWRDTPKVVFSSTLRGHLDWNTRLVPGQVPEIALLRAEGGGTPFFTALEPSGNINLVETLALPGGVVVTRYETRR